MQDFEWIEHNMAMERRAMDECWIELEAATTWEQVHEISKRLATHGLQYKQWKGRLNDLTDGRISAIMSA